MAEQHFFVNGRFLGSRMIPNFRNFPGIEDLSQHSHVYYCIRCGEIWARLIHKGATYNQLACRPCLKHGDGRLSCDPAWFDVPLRFEDDWPSGAIRWEFEACLQWAERQLERT